MSATEKEVYELNLTPSGTDTIITTREEFEALVKEAFEEEGRSDLLAGGAVTIRPQRPFPGVAVVLPILIWFGEQVALDIFKRKVLPKLEARFQAWWTKKPSNTPQPPESNPSEDPTPPESK